MILAGTALLFGPDLTAEEVGTALIALGAGLLLAVGAVKSARAATAAAGRSAAGTTASLLLVPQTILLAVIGLALLGFGGLLLAIVVGSH